mmetsp:Transcript_13402/g.32760  ORF Transcript_13402/g.32760 Transcript_13402/m.32760 type:complete len:321 (+) Transcript_13402:5-967(+)
MAGFTHTDACVHCANGPTSPTCACSSCIAMPTARPTSAPIHSMGTNTPPGIRSPKVKSSSKILTRADAASRATTSARCPPPQSSGETPRCEVQSLKRLSSSPTLLPRKKITGKSNAAVNKHTPATSHTGQSRSAVAFRKRTMARLARTTSAPIAPPAHPRSAKGTSSKSIHEWWYETSNITSFPSRTGLKRCSDIAATMAQKKARNIVLGGKYEDTSSIEKSTPPIGAPNATATPAAHAHDSSSRFLPSFARYLEKNRDTMFAAQHATCTNGPSFPRFIPDPTLNTSPTIFTTSVITPKKPLITNPPRMTLTSLMPLPAA